MAFNPYAYGSGVSLNTGPTYGLAPYSFQQAAPAPISVESASNHNAPRSLGSSGSESVEAGAQKNRWKLGVLLAIIVIVIGVLVAMGIAVYSQVRTHDSVIRLIRQYKGSFMVADGLLLSFDADLLDKNSEHFKYKASIFQDKLDTLFRLSGLEGVYEGTEVNFFKFIEDIPALEVHFTLKTKVEAELRIPELLDVLGSGIKSNVGGIFTDAVIIVKSLTIGNQAYKE